MFVRRARDELSAGDVSGAEKELERAQREAAAMEALAEKLNDKSRIHGVMVAGKKIGDAVKKLRSLKENKAKLLEVQQAVADAEKAAQHLETDEELRKREGQEKAEAEKEIRELILGAIRHLNRSEGTEAKLKLMQAEKRGRKSGVEVDFKDVIDALKAAEKYKYAAGSAEWQQIIAKARGELARWK